MHSDLNPKNLLVDPGTLEVTGVLDWEFAHAGCRSPTWATCSGSTATRRSRERCWRRTPSAWWTPPDDVLDQARAADLYALVDLAARRGENPVAERARTVLLAGIATTGDLHADPCLAPVSQVWNQKSPHAGVSDA